MSVGGEILLDLKCSFFGHRKITVTENLKQKIKVVIEDLIVNHNVQTFLFGSRSEFNSLCHLIVTELKEKYQKIKRVSYPCKNETCVLESEKKKLEVVISNVLKKEANLLVFEEESEHKTKYTAGKASYIERNKAMINDSNFCVFYFDKNYKPKMRKYSKNCASYYQPKSGTAIAYNYARKSKIQF